MEITHVPCLSVTYVRLHILLPYMEARSVIAHYQNLSPVAGILCRASVVDPQGGGSL